MNKLVTFLLVSCIALNVLCASCRKDNPKSFDSSEIKNEEKISPPLKSEGVINDNDSSEAITESQSLEPLVKVEEKIQTLERKEDADLEEITTLEVQEESLVDESKVVELDKENVEKFDSIIEEATEEKESIDITTNENDKVEEIVDEAAESIVVEDEIREEEKPIGAHDEWNALLNEFVSNSGKVNYEGFLSQKERLEKYLSQLQSNGPKANWSRSKKLAYWINAYNAFTVKLILDNYPLSSITDLEGGKPWDKKWIKIGAETYSLNNIENDIIRPQFTEPRIHFAVNCAAKSCPPLYNNAFVAADLEAQLEKVTKAFLRNTSYNTFDGSSAKVSKIFEWYAADFGDLKAFLSKYSNQKVEKVAYQEYNWALNK